VDHATETGAARATTVAVMMARVAMDPAMVARRGEDPVVPTALVAADMDRMDVVVPRGAALVIVVRMDVDLMTDGADRMVLPQEALVDGEAPMAAVLAVADVVPTNMVPAPWQGEWMKSTASSTKSSGKLSP
jgi:hypothetical protein